MNVRKSNGFSDYFSVTQFTYKKKYKFYNFNLRMYMMNTYLLSRLLIHKAMQIPVDIYQTNKKLIVAVQPKNACKLKFAGH